MADDLDPEDAKLVTLARGARGRIGASSGAALRDETGRTYSGADVALPSMPLSAVALVVAQAASSGSRGIETVVVVGETPGEDAMQAVRDLGGAGVPVVVCTPDGNVAARLIT